MTSEKDICRLIEILQAVRNKISPECDVLRSKYYTPQEVLELIDRYISTVQKNDLSLLGDINLDFCPTATFQEISMSNGWAQEYLILSAEFDEIYKRLK